MSEVTIENLNFSFGDRVLFDNASASIAPGTITALIGPNGAGKTTLFKLICNHLNEMKAIRSKSARSEDIGFMSQETIFPDLMSVKEAVQIILNLNNASISSWEQLVQNWTPRERERFHEMSNRLCKRCSVGERKWLFLRSLLSLQRQVYLLDEPTAGVDPAYRTLLWSLIDRAQKQGTTFVISSHLLDELGKRAGRILLINERKLQKFDTTDDVLKAAGATNLDDAFTALFAWN